MVHTIGSQYIMHAFYGERHMYCTSVAVVLRGSSTVFPLAVFRYIRWYTFDWKS